MSLGYLRTFSISYKEVLVNKIFFLPLLSLALVSCERMDNPPNNQRTALEVDKDNTARNVRDRDATATPFDQSETKNDLAITQKIRQAIVSDDSLSTNSKNIKIITRNGSVTLRGPVSSAAEKEAILKKVSEVQGIKNVDNQLEITLNK